MKHFFNIIISESNNKITFQLIQILSGLISYISLLRLTNSKDSTHCFTVCKLNFSEGTDQKAIEKIRQMKLIPSFYSNISLTRTNWLPINILDKPNFTINKTTVTS